MRYVTSKEDKNWLVIDSSRPRNNRRGQFTSLGEALAAADRLELLSENCEVESYWSIVMSDEIEAAQARLEAEKQKLVAVNDRDRELDRLLEVAEFGHRLLAKFPNNAELRAFIEAEFAVIQERAAAVEAFNRIMLDE